MNPSRRQKNQALACTNLLLAPVLLFHYYWYELPLSWLMLLWLIALGPVLLLALWVPATHARIRYVHMGLFLLTGTAIGFTVAALLHPQHAITPLHILWLPLGIAAAIFHYWPSKNDPYIQ